MSRPAITFRGGRLPHDPDRPHLKLSGIITSELPAPPEAADWLSWVPTDAWGMLGNDLVGDDYERLPQHSEALITWAAITLMTRRLTGTRRARATRPSPRFGRAA